jgi:hypothetical protein
METKQKTGTVDEVRRKLQPVVEGITERLNDPTVRDITGYGVRFSSYLTGEERVGIVTSMTFDLRMAKWVCYIKELSSGKNVRRKFESVEVILHAIEVKQAINIEHKRYEKD